MIYSSHDKSISRNLIPCHEKCIHLTRLKLNFVWHGDTHHRIKNIVRCYPFSLLILLLGLWKNDNILSFAANKNYSKDQSKITASLVPN